MTPKPKKRNGHWQDTLSQAVEFKKQHSRFPLSQSTDPVERALAHWISIQRNRRDLAKAKRQLLNKSLPGWQASPRNLEGTEERAQQLGQFRLRTGRWPRRHDPDPESRRLERWHRTQRSRGRDQLPQVLIKQLDENAPGWDEAFTRIATPRCSPSIDASTLRALYEQGSTLPEAARSANVSPPTARRMIVEAGGNIRAAGARLGHPQKPRETLGAPTQRRVLELAKYLLDSQQWPRRQDPDPKVRSLEKWLRTTRARSRNQLPAGLVDQLDKLAPGWDEKHRQQRDLLAFSPTSPT